MIDKTPTFSLREVQQKIFETYGRDVRGEKDTKVAGGDSERARR